MKNFMHLAILPLICLLPLQAFAESLSCSNGIVSVGDAVIDLVMKCGQPDWKEAHQEELTNMFAPGVKQRTYVTVEQWTYNFGPQQLLRIVTTRNGAVSEVRTGQYGPAAAGRIPGQPDCSELIISVGDSKGEVLAKCGKPFYRTSRDEDVQDRFDGTSFRKVVVTVEEWTYNFGPQRFMRIVTFRNGEVVDVKTGNYGR